MTTGGDRPRPVPSRTVADALAARRRADLVAGMRGLARPRRPRPPSPAAPPAPAGSERCDLCGLPIPDSHRHLIHLAQRRIVCSCEGCWAMRAGEGDYRPTGNRTLALPDLTLPDDVWASLGIPIGLAFFMRSTVTECVLAMYPSPAGATESELRFDSWSRVCELNPILSGLEPDIEGLIVNRLSDPPVYAIAPIDRCYALTGAVKATWDGISGGAGVDRAVTRFFDELLAETVRA
ncbi:MAG TPA: DUF5947 family protein [Solirubrobacteraceae bacterium]|nr:DUF5947 family protein [Solirubrobacteraceae bacterium]